MEWQMNLHSAGSLSPATIAEGNPLGSSHRRQAIPRQRDKVSTALSWQGCEADWAVSGATHKHANISKQVYPPGERDRADQSTPGIGCYSENRPWKYSHFRDFKICFRNFRKVTTCFREHSWLVEGPSAREPKRPASFYHRIFLVRAIS